MKQNLIIAPKEGRISKKMIEEKNAKELNFPCLYAGIPKRKLDDRIKKVTKSDEQLWKLRAKDRRLARNVCNMFFKYH